MIYFYNIVFIVMFFVVKNGLQILIEHVDINSPLYIYNSLLVVFGDV